jgi:hypothetical protein
MKEAPGSSETSVLTRATWRNNPEDTILDKWIVIGMRTVNTKDNVEIGTIRKYSYHQYYHFQ